MAALTKAQKTKLEKLQGIAATGKLTGSQQTRLVELMSQAPAPKQAAENGPLNNQQLQNLQRLQGLAPSGSLNAKQQDNLSRLTALSQGYTPAQANKAAASTQNYSNQALRDPLYRTPNISASDVSAPGSVSFQSASAPASVYAAQVAAEKASAALLQQQVFKPGSMQDIAQSLGLDIGKLTTGLSGQDYLANQDPSYQFQQDEARKAIEGSAAARGQALGGGTLKALQNRASQVAALDYQNAFARDLANRQLGLSTVNDQYQQLAGTFGLNAAELQNLRSFDVQNRGMDLQAAMANAANSLSASQSNAANSLQASITNSNNSLSASNANAGYELQAALANANNQLAASQFNASQGLQARMAKASNALTAQGLQNNMTQAQWDNGIQQRTLNLQQQNDIFNRQLATKNLGLQGLATTSGMLQNKNAAQQAGVNWGSGMLQGNQSAAQAGQNFGYGMLSDQQAYMNNLNQQYLANQWMNRNYQTGLLTGMVSSGQNAAGTLGNYAAGQGGNALSAGAGYGAAGAAGAIGAGNAWAQGLQGINNSVQGSLGNYMMYNLLK